MEEYLHHGLTPPDHQAPEPEPQEPEQTGPKQVSASRGKSQSSAPQQKVQDSDWSQGTSPNEAIDSFVQENVSSGDSKDSKSEF